MKKKYALAYLPLFEHDLTEAADYISIKLNNPPAALRLINLVEKQILKRLSAPLSFEHYPSLKNRKDVYYRIYIKNFTVFYIVKDDIMEVRRFIYSKRQLEEMI